jgi:hypothetical protein
MPAKVPRHAGTNTCRGACGLEALRSLTGGFIRRKKREHSNRISVLKARLNVGAGLKPAQGRHRDLPLQLIHPFAHLHGLQQKDMGHAQGSTWERLSSGLCPVLI